MSRAKSIPTPAAHAAASRTDHRGRIRCGGAIKGEERVEAGLGAMVTGAGGGEFGAGESNGVGDLAATGAAGRMAAGGLAG